MKQPSPAGNKPVRGWEEDVVIPTYPTEAANPNPMFFENRVYQGSSGKIYPNPITDRVAVEKAEKTYHAVILENEYIQVMVLPEIGGRIHAGLDKTNQYDFFYRQNVIKPALVGLLGPWISGGVEFNWPQHHRPSTFMPVHGKLENGADGSCTVWLSEHEPMNRMKGMVGICLYPGKSLIEAKVRLYNRTPLPQTFLWWANAGVHVHDKYQAFFPPDVTFVADHAKRAISSFPVARNFYYGIDYRQGTDISWYKNIPVPTSYMVTNSKYDFFGGYDHAKDAGLVQYSNHHVAPGKKLWTWGDAEFGHTWNRNLTDKDGPYIELMAGAYTDNQPDFSWLHPHETKSFSQFWYPIQKIGPAKNANEKTAINLEMQQGKARIGVCTTETLNVRVVLTSAGRPVYDRTAELQPGTPLIDETPLTSESDVRLEVFDSNNSLLISYTPESAKTHSLPDPATEPPSPSEIETNEELYLTGLHLEQYRHTTRAPESYWREGLERDPGDVRLNNMIGLLELRRGRFAQAEEHFRTAVKRLIARNPNPYDSEPYYNLGLALKYQGRIDEAYSAFYKCVWSSAWKSIGYYALAEIDTHRGHFSQAVDHLKKSSLTNADDLKARGLMASLLRRLERLDESEALVADTLAMDPLDFRALAEHFFSQAKNADAAARNLTGAFAGDIQTALDVTYDFASAGLFREAFDLLKTIEASVNSSYPIVLYTLSDLADRLGEPAAAAEYASLAGAAPHLYCFPSRLEEMILLETITTKYPQDAKALYYLGNLYYDKRRYEDAIRCWHASVALDPTFSIPWRNLGIAAFNILDNPGGALDCYNNAFAANNNDARLLYELDQLKKRMGLPADERFKVLDDNLPLVDLRDDLTVEYAALLNQVGKPDSALEILTGRRFSPWEGGEGLVSGEYVRAHLSLGRTALEAGNGTEAFGHFEVARNYPENLGEGKHLLTLERHLDYFAGLAAECAGDRTTAERYYVQASEPLPQISLQSYYQALALRKLGRVQEADAILHSLLEHARQTKQVDPRIDYFATSLPNLLLFEDDLAQRNLIECLLLEAFAELGMQNSETAIALFQKVQNLDPNNFEANQEIRRLSALEASSVED